jgi:hypothetical protein
MPTMWLSDSQSTSQQSTDQTSCAQNTNNQCVLRRNRRRLLQRRRLLLPLRPHPLLRPRPTRHGQHPLPHRHHAPPRTPAHFCFLRAEEQVEGHAGVLGGRAVDFDEVAAHRVWGGDVWRVCFVWGEFWILFFYAVLVGRGGDLEGEMLDIADERCDFLQQEFFKTIAGFAYNIPVVGPYLARGLQVAGDKAGANERAHKDLPV